MEDKHLLLLFGSLPIIFWATKIIGEKLINNYFEAHKSIEELKESKLDDRINFLNRSIDNLQRTMEKNTQELVSHKIMMQGLSHELSALRAETKNGQSYYKTALEKLATVLHSMNYQIKEQREEIDKLGRVIIKGSD